MPKDLKLFCFAAFFLGVAASAGFLFLHFSWGGYAFWDLQVYQHAIDAFNSGRNPYLDADGGNRFVYPPIFLHLFSPLRDYTSFTFILIYLFCFILLLSNIHGRHLIISSFIASGLLVSWDFTHAMLTGNITIFFHFLLIYLAVSSISPRTRSSHTVFLFAGIAAISLIKPYFLSYLILGAFVMEFNRRSIIYFFSALFFVAFFYLFQLVVMDQEFQDFITSLQRQAIGDHSGAGRDVGSAPYSFFGMFMGRSMSIYLHVIFVASISVLFYYLYRGLKGILPKYDLKIFCFWSLLIVLTLLNPRMKVYDFWIIQSCCVLVFWLFLRNDLFNLLHCICIFISMLAIFFVLRYMKYTGDPEIGLYTVYLSIYLPVFLLVFITFAILRQSYQRV